MLFDEASTATLQSIAKRAGVGQATLYRHFPSREDLLVAAYEDEFGILLSSAAELARRDGEEAGLREWLDELATLGRMKHALTGVLDAAARAELHDAQRVPLLNAIEGLLAPAKKARNVREDIHADDLLTLVSFLWHVPLSEDQTRQLLDVVVAGLSPALS